MDRRKNYSYDGGLYCRNWYVTGILKNNLKGARLLVSDKRESNSKRTRLKLDNQSRPLMRHSPFACAGRSANRKARRELANTGYWGIPVGKTPFLRLTSASFLCQKPGTQAGTNDWYRFIGKARDGKTQTMHLTKGRRASEIQGKRYTISLATSPVPGQKADCRFAIRTKWRG